MQQLRQPSFGSCSELGLTGDFRGEFPLDCPQQHLDICRFYQVPIYITVDSFYCALEVWYPVRRMATHNGFAARAAFTTRNPSPGSLMLRSERSTSNFWLDTSCNADAMLSATRT